MKFDLLSLFSTTKEIPFDSIEDISHLLSKIELLNCFADSDTFNNIGDIPDFEFISWIHKNPQYDLKQYSFYQTTNDFINIKLSEYCAVVNYDKYFIVEYDYAITAYILAYIKSYRIKSINKNIYHQLNQGLNIIIESINNYQVNNISHSILALDNQYSNEYYEYSDTVFGIVRINSISTYRVSTSRLDRLKNEDSLTPVVLDIVNSISFLIDLSDYMKSVAVK